VVRHVVPCSPCYRRDCRIGYLCLEGVDATRVVRESLAALAGGGRGAG
jgi:hypothetical protein